MLHSNSESLEDVYVLMRISSHRRKIMGFI